MSPKKPLLYSGILFGLISIGVGSLKCAQVGIHRAKVNNVLDGLDEAFTELSERNKNKPSCNLAQDAGDCGSCNQDYDLHLGTNTTTLISKAEQLTIDTKNFILLERWKSSLDESDIQCYKKWRACIDAVCRN